MTTGAASERPPGRARVLRPWCLVAALLGAVLALVPPLDTVARGSDYAAAVQFSLLAIVVPALTTLGSPWRIFTLSAGGSAVRRLGPVDRLAEGRRRHHELTRSVAYIGCDLAVVIAWHAPPAVAFVASAWWPAFVEAGILLLFGMGLWLELVHSPPLAPRSAHLRRAVLAAFAMWVFWVLAYVVGLSNNRFYPNFSHVAGGLSAAADQEIASALSWFVAAIAFVPVIFWNAAMWIKTEEDPDTELIALLREERRRATPPLNDGSEGTSSP